MIANHYATVFGPRWNWLALIVLTVAGALVRVWFVMRHKGRAPAWVWIAGVLCFMAAAGLVAPRQERFAAAVSFSEVQSVIGSRCLACHAERPNFQGLAEAPKGVKLDSPERIRVQALQIHRQSVLSTAMPPGNLTGMTEEERSLVDRWYRSGADTR